MRQNHLDYEDTSGQTILVQQLLKNNFAQATKIIKRGANINYINS